MKTRANILGTALCVAILGVGTAGADPIPGRKPLPVRGLPPYEVLTIIRSIGYDPLTQPLRKGAVYVLRALDPYDMEVRLTADAYTGRLLSVQPVVASARWPGLEPASEFDQGPHRRMSPFGAGQAYGTIAPPPPAISAGSKAQRMAHIPLPRPRPENTDPVSVTGSATQKEEATAAPAGVSDAMPPVQTFE